MGLLGPERSWGPAALLLNHAFADLFARWTPVAPLRNQARSITGVEPGTNDWAPNRPNPWGNSFGYGQGAGRG